MLRTLPRDGSAGRVLRTLPRDGSAGRVLRTLPRDGSAGRVLRTLPRDGSAGRVLRTLPRDGSAGRVLRTLPRDGSAGRVLRTLPRDGSAGRVLRTLPRGSAGRCFARCRGMGARVACFARCRGGARVGASHAAAGWERGCCGTGVLRALRDGRDAARRAVRGCAGLAQYTKGAGGEVGGPGSARRVRLGKSFGTLGRFECAKVGGLRVRRWGLMLGFSSGRRRQDRDRRIWKRNGSDRECADGGLP